MGQPHTHTQRYLATAGQSCQRGIAPSRGPDLYKMFRDKEDGCIKVIMRP
jgi:hypothetical protein